MAAMMASTVLAVSWILTAFILALTRKGSDDCSASHDGHDGFRHTSASMEQEGDEDNDSDSELIGSWSEGADATAAGHPVDPAMAASRKPRPNELLPLARFLVPPHLDAEAAVHIRSCVAWYASAIPATPFEAARMCNAVFGLQLDATAYGRLLSSPDEEVEAASEAKAEGSSSAGSGAARAAGHSSGGVRGGAAGAHGGYATLGRMVLESHVGRLTYSAYRDGADPGGASDRADGGNGVDGRDGDQCGLTVGRGCEDGKGQGDEGVGAPNAFLGRQGCTGAQADGASAAVAAQAAVPVPAETDAEANSRWHRRMPAASAVMRTSAAYVCPKVLAALSRRLRLDMLARAAPARGAPGLCEQAARGAISGAGLAAGLSACNHRYRQTACAVGAAAGEGGAAALLRLVWEAHVRDPGAAWHAACVLVGLAHQLKLVGL